MLDFFKFLTQKVACIIGVEIGFVVNVRQLVFCDKIVYILSGAIEQRTDIFAAYRAHSAKSSYARTANYAHKHRFHLVVRMVRKRDKIAFSVRKHLVENIVAQYSRALLRGVAVLLAKRWNVNRKTQKRNIVFFAKFFDEFAVVYTAFAPYSVFDVDGNQRNVRLFECIGKRNGIPAAA